MQHAALVLSLEKSALQSIKTQLLLLQKKNPTDHNHAAVDNIPFSQNTNLSHESALPPNKEAEPDLYDNELTAIKFEHFALTLLNHMNNMTKLGEKRTFNYHQLYTQTTSFYLQMASIIAVFDSVDIDSRGVIAFNDFVDFCLRLGRLLLKPSIKSTFSTYLQYEGSKGSLFPSHKMRYFPSLNALFVLDTETPRVRVYKKDGKFLTRVNPITEAKRLIRHQGIQKTTYYEKSNYEKEFSNMKSTERDFDESKGQILDCCYIDSLKQVIFSSTHGYLFFMDASIGFKDNALNSSKRDDAYCVQHYLKTKYPQFGLFYSSILNLLIGYPGEGSEHFFEIFDPVSRTLKYQIMKHECKILSLCEVILDKAHPSKDHYFVSSSIDKKVIMWPTAPMSTLVGQTQTKRLLRVADIIDYELRGHSHAIQSLAYAVHNEILFGCGFDFEVIAWDPFSRDVCMKFIGHFKSLASVQIAYIPDEKLLSLDEAGTLKVWNINKDLGIYGNQESSVTVHCSQPAHIKDFVVTHDRGKGVAILAEKVYYLNVETDVLEELKPVQNGFGFCPTAGRVFTIFRSTIHLFDICQSKKIKKISFLDPDRISSSDEIVSHSEEMRMDAPGAANNNNKNNNNETTGKSSSSFRHQPEKEEEEDKNTLKYFNRVDIHDIITAVAMDGHGKKVFLGTRDGRILLFDSYTFGLVKQLTTELEDPAFLYQGSIIGLHYLDRDENLVAAYDNGAVKVYGGCLRAAAFGGGLSGGSDEKRSQSFNSSTVPPLRKSLSRSESISHIAPMKDDPFGSNFNGNFAFYGTSGGKAPTKPSLLRETDIGYILDHSVKALAVSSDHNLVATMTKTGLIFVYDYLTLDFFICLSMEEDIASSTFIEKSLQYLFIEFLPSVPVLLVVDNQNRVSAWGLKGMGNRFLLSWNVYEDIIYNNNKDLNTFYAGFDFQGANPVTMTTPTFFNQLNPQITLIKSFSFMSDAAASSIAVTAAATVVGMGGGTRVSFTAPPPSSSSLGDSLAINTRKKKVIAVENDQRWLIILTTEDGIVLTQNLTPLLERSGAIDHLAKLMGIILFIQRLNQSDIVLMVWSIPRQKISLEESCLINGKINYFIQ